MRKTCACNQINNPNYWWRSQNLSTSSNKRQLEIVKFPCQGIISNLQWADMRNTSLNHLTLSGYNASDDDSWFFEQIASASGIDQKLELLWWMAQNLGFTDVFHCKLIDPQSQSPLNRANVIEHRFGDRDWHSIYSGLNYSRFDWTIEHASSTKGWFRLDTPPKNLSFNQERVVRHAREYGRQNGFCFPLNNSLGVHGGFSATGCDRRPTQSQMMRMISVLQLAELTMSVERQEDISMEHGLNSRELKIIRMLAAGRSMTQIASITGKTDQWIRLSVSQIRKKLKVSSNTQLIYRAVKLNLIWINICRLTWVNEQNHAYKHENNIPPTPRRS